MLLLFSVGFTFGQTYSFEVLQRNYEPLTESYSVTNGYIWLLFDAEIPLGLEFNYFGQTSTSLYVYEDFSAPHILTTSDNPIGTNPFLMPFGASIVDRAMDEDYLNEGMPGGLSEISYHHTTIAGERVFILEYENVGFEGDITLNGISTDFANFQVWIYDSDIIEIHFGESSITDFSSSFLNQPGPIVSLMPEITLDGNANGGPSAPFYSLNGPAQAPQLQYGETMSYITGMPPSGTVYRFTPMPLSVNETASSARKVVYPSLITNVFNIKDHEKFDSLRIFAADGTLVKKTSQLSAQTDISDLPPGVYFIVLENSSEKIRETVIKK